MMARPQTQGEFTVSTSSDSQWPKTAAQWALDLKRSRNFYRELKARGLPVPDSIVIGGKERIRRIITLEDHQAWIQEMRRLSAEFEAAQASRRGKS